MIPNDHFSERGRDVGGYEPRTIGGVRSAPQPYGLRPSTRLCAAYLLVVIPFLNSLSLPLTTIVPLNNFIFVIERLLGKPLL